MPPARSEAKPADPKSGRGPGITRQILAFVLETALLFAVAYSAIAAVPAHPVLAAIAALAVAVALWAVFMAPRAKRRLPWPALPVAAGCAFLAGAAGLLANGLLPAALLLAAAALVNLVWDLATGRPAAAAPPRPAGRRAARP